MSTSHSISLGLSPIDWRHFVKYLENLPLKAFSSCDDPSCLLRHLEQPWIDMMEVMLIYIRNLGQRARSK